MFPHCSNLLLLTLIVTGNSCTTEEAENAECSPKSVGSDDRARAGEEGTTRRAHRLLLTGASGFGGSHALRHFLINTDWEIICPVSFSHRGLPARIVNALESPDKKLMKDWWSRVTIIKCDLSCPIDDLTLQRLGRIDYIINYASESAVDRSIRHPRPFIKNNIDLVLNLLEFARQQYSEGAGDLKMFVQISTDEVYGPAAPGQRHAEWSSIIPSNPYAASKAAQEAIAISYWRAYGLPLVLVNCMNLIGETQDPEKLVPKVISRVMKGLPVPIFASLNEQGQIVSIGSRFYLHARDLADAILFLVKRGSPTSYSSSSVQGGGGGADAGGGDRPDRWNVVGAHEIDNLEMARLIAKILDKPLNHQFVDFHKSRPGHDARYALDGAKLEEAGWRAPTSEQFENSLRKLVKWTEEHPLWADRDADDNDALLYEEGGQKEPPEHGIKTEL